MKKIIFILLVFSVKLSSAQLAPLTVEKIMRDPKWIGVSPDNVQWSEDSRNIYFTWNPTSADRNELYKISVSNFTPVKVQTDDRNDVRRNSESYNRSRSVVLFEQNGDLFLQDIKGGKKTQLTNTVERESSPQFSYDEQEIYFQRGDNLYALSTKTSAVTQLTNFTRSQKRPEKPLSKQDQWLKNDQLKQFEIIRENDKNKKLDDAERKAAEVQRPKEFYLDDRSFLNMLKISPDKKYITFRVIKQAEGNRNTVVPNYVTASGYTEDINGRTKVGNTLPTYESYIYNILKDTIYSISAAGISGIKDIPEFVKDYPKQFEERQKRNEDRKISISGPYWNEPGTSAFVVIYSQDNKDRWIMKLDPETAKLTMLDRQHDEAWIGGPGIGGGFGGGNVGWIDNSTIYFQSEATGYSHLYSMNISSGVKKQLTSRKYEVQSLKLSNDKKSFYFSANIEHPGITHFYKIPVAGGNPLKITAMKGGNEVELSPDEKWLAIRYSSSNKPWELYVQENKAGAKATKVTSSTSKEFNSYAWREPDMVSFKNRYGADVYARVYKAVNAPASKPAVVFVHGAGYLQNVHYWWSQYFREYMFNNMLADNGYTVIDIDYTASSGYGRDHRTGIYRHMGGKDLSDQVDGVKYLVENYGVNPKNVGLYGGSYGGFITLMGLFTEPDVFKSGAGLRSVTDWAHYNHGYTSNILNEPVNDEKAYAQSSPINFADGLKGNLLMCHGMVDVNVNFQDIVRLSQKLIELKKENWELAVYPVEDHGFVQPSSWMDEYKRIFRLFETTLK